MKGKVSLLLFCTLLILFFHGPLFFLQPYFGVDLFEHVPAKLWMADQLKQGTLPLWNPYHSCGMPMAADDFTWGIYYPGMPFHLLWPGFGFTLEALVHLIISFYFIRKLILFCKGSEAGALFAGITFNLGAPMLSLFYAGDASILNAACWLPAIFYFTAKLAAEGRGGVSLALILALQILGGHPEIVFFTVLFSSVLALALGPKRWQKLWIPFGLALGLAAIHLIPVAEVYASESMRNEYWTFKSSADQTFPLSFSFSLLTSGLFGTQSAGTYWGPPFDYLLDKYLGAIPWMLVLLAFAKWKDQLRLSKWMLGSLCLSLFIAFGRGSGFSQIADFFPIVRDFSVPSNMMIFVAFFASIVAALQWDQLSDKKNWVIIGLLFGISAAGYLLIHFDLLAFPDSFFRIPLETRRAVALQATIVTCLILVLTWACLQSSKREGLLLLLQILSLAYFASHWIQSTSLQSYLSPQKWRLITKDKELARVFEHVSLPFVDKPVSNLNYSHGSTDGIYFHIFQLQGGTTTLALKGYHEFKAFLNFADFPKRDRHFHLTGIDSPLLKYANVGYLISAVLVEDPAWEYLGRTVFYNYRLRNVAPRARIFYDYSVEPDPKRTLQKMSEKEGLYLEQQISDKAAPIQSTQQEGKAEIISYSPDEIELQTSSEAPGWLYLSEIYFPGWHATVDGVSCPIVRANYTFRAIPLPAGQRHVRMWYRPASWIAGCLLSISSAFLLLVFRKRL